MSRLVIDLATPADDFALRRLMAANSMEGSIELAFLREPSYFLGTAVQAPFHQVIVARNGTGEPVGVGLRGVRRTWLNGGIESAGYLADLRLHPSYRGGTVIARGYRFLHQLHADGRARIYLTVIAEENSLALETIATGRAGLPRYEPLGRIVTAAVNFSSVGKTQGEGSVNDERPSQAREPSPLRRGEKVPKADEGSSRVSNPSLIFFEKGSLETRPEILACLERNLSRRQFAPVVDAETLETFRDLTINDFYVARKHGKVVGVAAMWDQSAFKQTRVVRYRGAVRLLRPLYNAAAPLLGVRRYPPAGQDLHSFHLSFIAVDDDDREVFRSLLQRVHDDQARSGYHYFLVGLHERDPLFPVLEEFRVTPFYARAFAVHFEDGDEVWKSLDDRIPHVELAML